MRLSSTQLIGYAALGLVILVAGLRLVAPADAEPAVSSPVDAKLRQTREPGRLIVHVAGAVRRPGVYGLRPGSRIEDALKRAGGPLRAGDTDAINLAARLTDGQQVRVPEHGTGAGVTSAGTISLGSATAADLETLDGIGPVTAGRIIEYREAGNTVGSVDDLDPVPGIGPATIEALRDQVQP